MKTLQQTQTLTESGPFGCKAIQIYIVAILFYTTSHILLILVPLGSHALGATPSQIGLIMGGYMFTSMFLRPIAGKIVDKFGVNRIFAAALILNVLALSFYAVQELWVFALLRIIQGIILSFFSMISHLMIIEVLPEKARGQGLSLFSLSSMLPYTYGPFLTLYIMDKVPQTYLFLALIPIGLTTFLIGINIRLPDRSESHAIAAHTHSKQTSGSYQVWKDRKLWFPSIIMLMASAVIGTVAAFLPLYMETRGLPYAGVYFLTETVVLIVLRFFGRSFIPTGRRFPIRMVGTLILLLTTAAGLIRVAEGLPLLLVAAACNGIALSMLYPTLVTYVSFVVPERFRGRGIGLFIAAADFGTSVGTMGLSLLAGVYSYDAMFTGCLVTGVSALLVIFLFSRAKGVIE